MVYVLNNNLICSTDGSITNIQPAFNKWRAINDYYILPEAGELYYKGVKYEIVEPSILIETTQVNDIPSEVLIIPCGEAVNKLAKLVEIKKELGKKKTECSDCVESCCD